MLTVKHRDTLGWYVDMEGIRLTDYTQIRAKAENDLAHILGRHQKAEQDWAETVIEAHREENRTKAWIKMLEAKYHARHIRAEKVTFYNNAQAISMAMQK